MNKLITIIVLLLMIPGIAGCQPQSVENQGTLPAKTAAGPLTLEITSPEEGSKTSWGFITVRGTVSPASAVVSIENEGYARVEEDGSFESDYIVLSEGRNEIRVTVTTGSEEVTKTVTVNYKLQLNISISPDLEPGRDWFTESRARIGGRVSDPHAGVTINGRKAEVGNDGYILAMIELKEGTNGLRAVASLGDQTATDTCEVIYVSPPALAIEISAPANDFESKLDLVKITGAVSDPEAHVVISNISITGADSPVAYRFVPARVTAGGAFYAYIALEKGDNRIEAQALRGSDRITDTIDIGYHPPLINFADGPDFEITSPQNNAEYHTNMLPVNGTVDDPTATVLVNDIEAVVAADGSYKGCAVLNETGENIIEVIAINDTAKTVRTITVTFVPPLVVSRLDVAFDPQGDDYTKGPVTVSGKVNKPEATVTVAGKEVTVAADGSFTGQAQLTEGSNSITAIATLGDERDEAYVMFIVEDGRLGHVPGYSGFFMSQLIYESEIKLKAGETYRLPVTLETRKDGPGKFSGSFVYVGGEYGEMPLPWPKGLDAYLEPPEFTAYPNATYNFDLVVSAAPEIAPGVYYLRFYHVFEQIGHGRGWMEVTVE